MEQATAFGQLPDGGIVHAVTIGGDDLEVRLLSLGARMQDLRFRTGAGWRRVILGFPRLDGFLAPNSRYSGAIVGRFANRIGAGRFALDGRTYQLPLNEHGRTHLHGGTIGFSGRVWRVLDHTQTAVTFGLTSPDGEEGYPGAVEATCRYELTGPGELTLVLNATTDRPTPISLACHPFFDLDGTGDIRDHELEILRQVRARRWMRAKFRRGPSRGLPGRLGISGSPAQSGATPVTTTTSSRAPRPSRNPAAWRR